MVLIPTSASCSNLSKRVIIHRTELIAKLPAYRVIQHASIACSINITAQIIAASFTLQGGEMDYTLNSINGAIFQGSWAVEYPMILILAVNRLLSVAWPLRARHICNIKLANVLLILCWAFGAFNTTLCLSGQVQTIWIVPSPGFVFTNQLVIATSTATYTTFSTFFDIVYLRFWLY
ncbi:hypothetical protein Y032_0069g348 [Ancylostoma ceylanicum]|uniref:7TM GPCR serpentine receptor class x (Srx) domain-containing protein n=1 Tax=Ancylostoma ceylanicum TaxID=53326 RepID=A0A016TY40_9BILA|nr:hypothetical protein Y032_0069g348 [Ancylostoma ceylanicum]